MCLTTRQCGALEAADTLLGISLFGTDKNTTIEWVDVRIGRNRRLKPWQAVSNMHDDETDMFCPSLVNVCRCIKRYICLYNFAANYDIVNKKPKTDRAKYYEYVDAVMPLMML